jgi:hypothetical protein
VLHTPVPFRIPLLMVVFQRLAELVTLRYFDASPPQHKYLYSHTVQY